MISGALRHTWVGLLATVAVVFGAVMFEALYGPLYGTWDWREMSIALLVILASLLAGVEALMRQPNPYSRSHPLYDLHDVPPDRNLDSSGGGWLLQAIPPAVVIVVLAVSLFA